MKYCYLPRLDRLSVSDDQCPQAGNRRTHDLQMSAWLQGVWRKMVMVIERRFPPSQAHPLMHRMCRCLSDDMMHFMSRCSTELGCIYTLTRRAYKHLRKKQTR
jgi:hypothetical protein